MRKKETANMILMPTKGTCERKNPTIADCLDCMVNSIYVYLVFEDDKMQALDCLHILANIHRDVKKRLGLKMKS